MSRKLALVSGGSRGIGAPKEVASERASWVAGQILQPNGGMI
jgi:NAD(P)-dependent dehydrogenase (short-subunit alcohol dehydrogenase family)